MRAEYRTATNYTLRSPRFEQRGTELRIFIEDDQSQNQSAAEYLFPTDAKGGVNQKEVLPTTLSGVLRKFGSNKIAAPVPGSRAGRQFIDKRGNLKGKKVQSLISQLLPLILPRAVLPLTERSVARTWDLASYRAKNLSLACTVGSEATRRRI